MMGLGERRLGLGSGVGRVFWLTLSLGPARLPLGGWRRRRGRLPCERAPELVEWPGWEEVGSLLFERGSNGLGSRVVEVKQEVVGVGRWSGPAPLPKPGARCA
jgi:hypothetical protein